MSDDNNLICKLQVMPEAREQIQPIAQAADAMLARAATSTKRKREEM